MTESYGACAHAQHGNVAKYSWLIAVLFCLGGAIVSNLGVNLQKLALTHKQRHTLGATSYRLMWMLGFLGITGGAIADFAALGFGAQSVVAPLGSLTLVANVVLAPMMQKEQISRQDLFATGLIVGGCSLAVAFASHKDCLYSLDTLIELYDRVQFALYAGTIAALIFGGLLLIRWMERRLKRHGRQSAKYQAVFKYHRFSYACISGIIGAQSILFAKTSVEMVMDSARGGTLFLVKPLAYVILLSMASTVALQIYWLNCGLARWDALYNVPVFQSFWILVSVIGGGIHYNEFSSFGVTSALLFPAGVIVTVVGVYMLSQRESSKQGDAAGSKDAATSTERRLLDDGSQAPSEPQPEEIQVEFHDLTLGLRLRMSKIKLANVRHPSVKKLVNVWAVAGFGKAHARGEAAAAATQDEASKAWAERCGKLKIGDIITAIGGDSVLDNQLSHVDVLRRINNASRPVTITFLRPVMPVFRRRASTARSRSGTSESATQATVEAPRTPPHSGSRPRVSTGGVTDVEAGSYTGRTRRRSVLDTADHQRLVASVNEIGVNVDDDSEDSDGGTDPIEIPDPSGFTPSHTQAHASLKHLSLDPLGLMLHAGQLIGPGQIDTDDNDEVHSNLVVQVVDKLFPDNGPLSKFANSIVTTLDPDTEPVRRRRHSIGEPSAASYLASGAGAGAGAGAGGGSAAPRSEGGVLARPRADSSTPLAGPGAATYSGTSGGGAAHPAAQRAGSQLFGTGGRQPSRERSNTSLAQDAITKRAS